MFVRIKGRKVTADQVRETSVRLATAFGADRFYIVRPEPGFDRLPAKKQSRHALAIVKEWEQDGPTIKPEKGETFVKLHLWGRYYGPGYERGDIVFYLAIARWLRTAFAPCEVWYGGDSSGVLAQHLDDAYEQQLWNHFCSRESRAYFQREAWQQIPDCEFCKVPMASFGGGRGYEFVSCQGCGASFDLDLQGQLLPSTSARNDGGPPVQRHELVDLLYAAVAALSLDETRVLSGRYKVDGSDREGAVLELKIQTSWNSLTSQQRSDCYERALEMFGERAKQELAGGAA